MGNSPGATSVVMLSSLLDRAHKDDPKAVGEVNGLCYIAVHHHL